MEGRAMIKKLLITTIAMVMCAGLLACGDGNKDTSDSNLNETKTQQAEAKGYAFESAGTAIEINSKVDTYTNKFGKPKGGYYEAKSCAFEGLDKFWYYDGFTIQAYQKDGADLVYSVTLTDDTVKTKEGVKIGDTKDKMTSVYGGSFKADGTMCCYEAGNMKLEFNIKDDVIISIAYTLKTN